ncbi:MAG: hypothetical protein V4692_14405, partial [Bdellovibrionota bacterium]
MKKLIQISTLCLTLFACIPASQAATSNDDLFWNLKLQNRNACARESKEPARGFYLYVDGVTFGRAAAKVARNGKQDIGTSVQKAWTELHRSLLITTQSVVEAMLANRLPLVESPSAVDAAKLVAALETASLLDVDQRCQEIKKPLPMAAGDVNPTARSLTVLAQSYLKADEFIGKCSSIAQREAGSASLALKWNLVRELKNGDQKLTFEFWQSFKIYLSAAWKLGVFKKHAPQFGAWLQSFPIEEMTLLIADGCQSLSRPACNSDFLSEAQLSTFASTTEFKRSALLGRSFTDGLLNSDASS